MKSKTAGIILIMLVGLFFMTSYVKNHTFTPEKWLNDPENRYRFVDHLNKKYELTGMTRTQVTYLLGEEDEYADSRTTFKISNEYFEPENTLVYYLGVRYMDDMWLIILLADDIVTGYIIDVT